MRTRVERIVASLFLALAGIVVTLAACSGWEEPVARSSEDMVWLRKEQVTLSATGDSATGTASTDREIAGYVYAVYIDYATSISDTTDLTLTMASPALTVLALTDVYTDGWYYPVVQQHGSTGAAVASYERLLVADQIDVTAAETTSGTETTITIYWGQ